MKWLYSSHFINLNLPLFLSYFEQASIHSRQLQSFLIFVTVAHVSVSIRDAVLPVGGIV